MCTQLEKSSIPEGRILDNHGSDPVERALGAIVQELDELVSVSA